MTTLENPSHEVESVPQWQLDLDRVGFVRRLFLARRWYGGDWWFVAISAVLLLFIIIVGVFPQWFAPYDPRAEVGPSLLAPGEMAPAYVLVAPKSAKIESLRQVASTDNTIAYLVGTPASQACARPSMTSPTRLARRAPANASSRAVYASRPSMRP
jgi:ABC-type dipeptide/oligopeptide/nickel transport system permease subunit